MSLVRRLSILETLERYVDENLFMPSPRWPTYEFDVRCYERWAANEVIYKIMHETEDPIVIMQDFYKQVKKCMFEADSPEVRLIFSTAVETIEELGSLLV